MVPVTRASTGLKALAAADYDPVGANITSVYKWIDQSDSGMTGASQHGPRAAHPAEHDTPLGRSMFYSRLYFENYVYPNDPEEGLPPEHPHHRHRRRRDLRHGRPVRRSTPPPARRRELRDVQPRGSGLPRRHSAVIPKGVLVYILTDNGLSTDEKATANAMAAAGGTGQAIFVTLTDTNAGQAGAGRHHRQDRPARARSATAPTTTATARSTKACRTLPTCTLGNTIAACGSFTSPPTADRSGQRRGQNGGTPGTARSRPATAWTTTATARSTRASAERLRPALRLRRPGRDLRRPRQRLRRRHRRRLHGRRRRASTTASAPAAAAASSPARPTGRARSATRPP